jgi:TolB-like protein
MHALLAEHRKPDMGKAQSDHLSAERSGPPVIAVIPFANLSGDEFWSRLADGLSADIIIDLARDPDLAVIARQTMNSYKGRRDDVRSIGRELGADYVLEGTLQAAWAALGIAYSVEAFNGYSPDPAASSKRSRACLERAVQLDPADSLARICLGESRALYGDLKKCAEENEYALSMAPNDADTLAMSAGTRALVTGDASHGYELAK